MARSARSLIDRDLVIFGVDLDQYSPFLYVLIVAHIHADDVAANASTDGIKMGIDLCVVGRFVFGEVAPKEEAGRADDDKAEEQKENVRRRFGRAGARSPMLSADWCSARSEGDFLNWLIPDDLRQRSSMPGSDHPGSSKTLRLKRPGHISCEFPPQLPW